MSEETKFAEDCLSAINEYRANHQVEPLTYNRKIEDIASKWADHIAHGNVLKHNPDRDYKDTKLGENVAYQGKSSRDEITGPKIAEQWYSEIEGYDFEANCGRAGTVTGHFTQVVWKDSRELGIARSQTKDGDWMIVANFFPPGNYNNDYANNVFPPKDGKIPTSTKKDDKQNSESQQPAMSFRSSKQTMTSTINGVTTTTTTETTTDENGVEKVKVTEKVERPGSPPKVKVTLTTTNPDGSTTEETSCPDDEKSRPTPTKALTPSTNGNTSTDNDFCRDVVNSHNKFRQSHRDTEDLVFNEKLTDMAQSWADHLAKTKSLQHSRLTYEGRPVGESIASKHGTGHVDYAAEEVVSQWYKESEKYDFRNPPDSHSGTGTGHFTQVVWRDSKEIGVGKAFSGDNRVYVVALYYPAGNYVGRQNYETNVQPLKHEKSDRV